MTTPKYNIGDKVWLIEDGKAVEKEVCGVMVFKEALESEKVMYRLEIARWTDHIFQAEESDLFPTKEELIKSL